LRGFYSFLLKIFPALVSYDKLNGSQMGAPFDFTDLADFSYLEATKKYSLNDKQYSFR